MDGRSRRSQGHAMGLSMPPVTEVGLGKASRSTGQGTRVGFPAGGVQQTISGGGPPEGAALHRGELVVERTNESREGAHGQR